MATLKICTMSRTRWLPGIRSVESLAVFSTPEEHRKTSAISDPSTARRMRLEKEKAIVDAAIGACGDDMAAGIQLAEFWEEEMGAVLRVQQSGFEDKIWIVPDRSCYLISDTGKTIDRI